MDGKGKAEAYKDAGGKSATYDDQCSVSSRMSSNVNVKSFLQSIYDQQLTNSVMTRQEALEKLSNIGRTSINDLVTYGKYQVGEDEEGNPIFQSCWEFKKSVKNDPKKMEAISELSAGPHGLKIKLEGQTKGIEGLRKMEGWDAPEKVEAAITGAPKTWGDLCAAAQKLTNKDDV